MKELFAICAGRTELMGEACQKLERTQRLLRLLPERPVIAVILNQSWMFAASVEMDGVASLTRHFENGDSICYTQSPLRPEMQVSVFRFDQSKKEAYAYQKGVLALNSGK